METAKIYYESHITIDPILDKESRVRIEEIAGAHGFKLAKFTMQKGDELPKDTFLTGHEKYLDPLIDKMSNAIAHLKSSGFRVKRYKIEDIVLDSRSSDTLKLL